MNIEELAGLGKITKEVEPLEGVKVLLHSLTAGEEQKVHQVISAFPNDIIARAKPLQIETLVNSIESINGKLFRDSKELRDFLTNLQGSVLDHLYNAYISLEQESADTLDKLKKNSGVSTAV